MKIAVIQASTQVARNQTLYQATKEVVAGKSWEVVNFGVSADEGNYSYVQIALCAGLLLNSGAVDFIVTGCSSGQGMAIAANALPGVICGYLPTPSDAYLFGRINQGNCASLPLGLGFGWAGEINLRYTLRALFESPMNTGYPATTAARKREEAKNLRAIKALAQTDIISLLSQLEKGFVQAIFAKRDLMDYVIKHGTNARLVEFLARNNQKK